MAKTNIQNRNLASGLVALKQIVEGTAGHTGIKFFKSLVKNLAHTLDTHAVWVTEYLEQEQKLDSLAFWLDNDYVKEYIYFVENTPCEPVINNDGLYHIPENIIKLYPKDPDLAPLGAVSYLGLALKDETGKVLGHLALLDNKPMDEIPEAFAIFKIFAARAEAELRRLKAEKKLVENELKLKRLVNGTMDAMLELNERLQIIQSNDAAQTAFGAEETLVGQHLKDFLTTAGLKKIIHCIDQLDAKENQRKSIWIKDHLIGVTKNNEQFPAEATLSNYSAKGTKYYALFFRNVKDRVKAAEAIKMLNVETTMLREKVLEQGFDNIIGESPKIMETLTLVQQVAPTDSTVLVRGETGTGKELFARAIHKTSKRSDKPLVTLNCAALPPDLVESELFGHVKGAFTGATTSREGRFSLAHKGTLFLDEIGELPLSLQAKLLRVLQEGEFEPVGSSKTEKVDVRVIAATNRNLKELAKDGKFREDLYYRLNVFPIYIPPLRERGKDVILIANAFIDKYCKRTGKTRCQLAEIDKQSLLKYDWLGNVRELQNIVERALIIKKGNQINLSPLLPISNTTPIAVVKNEDQILTESEIRYLEKKNIIKALEITNWKIYGKNGAAELLQIPGTTLSSRIKKLKIKQ